MENKHKKFNAFDKVLVKYGKVWVVDFYRNYVESSNIHLTLTGSSNDEDILPYEGNEHLVGTAQEPEEVIELKEGERILCSDNIDRLENGYGVLEDFCRIERDLFMPNEGNWAYKYSIRFSDFNPNNMEETRRHILCVKNGKIIRYKG